jgi:hypothetical protein
MVAGEEEERERIDLGTSGRWRERMNKRDEACKGRRKEVEDMRRNKVGMKMTHAPKPNINTSYIKLHRVYTSSGVRKAFAKAILLNLRNATPTPLRTVTVDDVSTISRLGCGRGGQGTPWVGVDGHLVMVHEVDALDDVNFACVGPFEFTAERPERGPDLLT